ncbi:MAG: tetratricopeptide repeat protein, partial [Thermoanaerobaculia bacterium]
GRLCSFYTAAAFEGNLPPRPAFAEVELYATRGLALQPDLPEARIGLAAVYFYRDGDLAKSEAEFQKSFLDLPMFRWQLGVLNRELGRFEESIRDLDAGLAIDPMWQQLHLALGTTKLWKGAPEAAVKDFSQAVSLYPRSTTARELLSDALASAGDQKGAIRELARTLEMAGFFDWADDLQADFLNHGFTEAQRQLALKRLASLQEQSRRRYVAPIAFAGLELLAGDRGASLDWLDKAAQEGSMWLHGIGLDPAFAPLRKEPRFQAIVAKYRPRGLPDLSRSAEAPPHR